MDGEATSCDLQALAYKNFNMFKKYPTTIIVAALAVAAFAFPSLTDAWQLDWRAIGNGQWWRLLTGHATHYGASHLFWDLLMFVVLSLACEAACGAARERACRVRYALRLTIMMLGVSAGVGLFCKDIAIYRGLSGIDTGLFVWFVIDQARDAWQLAKRTVAIAWVIPLIGLIGKLVYEAATGDTLFVESGSFRPLVEAHLAGAVMGLMISVAGTYSGVPEAAKLATETAS